MTRASPAPGLDPSAATTTAPVAALRRRQLLGVLGVVFAGVVSVNRHAIAAGLSYTKDRLARGDRVDAARARKKDTLPAAFQSAGLSWPPRQVFLRIFKATIDGGAGSLELWASNAEHGPVTLVKTYPVCAKSGTLGPKRRQGDLQVPEGFYQVEKLNPQSTYHLALRVNYPNASDRIRGRAAGGAAVDLGGDIMVHGSCVTVGCIPIEDDPIEEVYLVVDAVFPRRAVPIHIFPCPLTEAGLAMLATSTAHLSDGAARLAFFRELAVGYRAFEAGHVVPVVDVDPAGAYVVRG